MTWALTHWKPLSVAAGLALAFAAGKWTARPPPAPAVHAVEASASEGASKDSKGPVDTTTVIEQYGPPSPCGAGPRPPGDYTHWAGSSAPLRTGAAPSRPDDSSVTGPLVSRTTTTEHRGPEVIEAHGAAQTHLDLTVTPPTERPGWAVGVGASVGSKQLRLELDRRLFGNLWVGASMVPARREVGVGLRMEF